MLNFLQKSAIYRKVEKNKKISKKVLTKRNLDDIIILADRENSNTERYRSGHNEAVLKTVCPQGRVGSNPTLSAGENDENQLTKMSKKLEKVFDKQR